MKIEIFSEPIGISANFFGDRCESKISEAHGPLVTLESRLPAAIHRFLTTKGIRSFYTVEYVELIDSEKGICLVAYLIFLETGLFVDSPKLSLRDEFKSFLSVNAKNIVDDGIKKSDMRGMHVSPVSSLPDPGMDQTQPIVSENQSPFLFLLNSETRLPEKWVVGECCGYHKNPDRILVTLPRREIEVIVENEDWMNHLYQNLRSKNCVKLLIQAINDGKQIERQRSPMSYQRFRLIETPIIQILDKTDGVDESAD
jgi:hypothetical protein